MSMEKINFIPRFVKPCWHYNAVYRFCQSILGVRMKDNDNVNVGICLL